MKKRWYLHEEYNSDSEFRHSVMDSIPDIAIFSLDRDYRYIAFTRLYKEIIKQTWNADIKPGINMLDLIPKPEDRNNSKINLDKVLAGESFVCTETFGIEPDQHNVYENHYSPMKSANEKIIGLTVLVIDITQISRTIETASEAKMNEALKKAEAGNRLKTSFLQNISHEIRTPLNGILGFGALLADPKLSADKRTAYNQYLKESSNRLMNTITNYMDISLIESDNIDVSRKVVHTKDVLNRLIPEIQSQCEIKNLKFNFIFPWDDHDDMLITDQEILTKCISHLLDNAVKFTPTGSVTLEVKINPETVDFTISDTGIGISPENQKKIFGTFIQEDTNPNRGYEGNGLGLSIVHGLTRLLGGEISLESTKGEGSKFLLSLPRHFKGNEYTKPSIIRKGNIGEKEPVILIAEDDPLSSVFLEITLKEISSKVYKASTGIEAVEICRDHPEISLVLMDMKMPLLNGYDATKQIKKFRKDLTVIAITALALSQDKAKVMAAGCTDYIAKPAEKEEILHTIKKYLN